MECEAVFTGFDNNGQTRLSNGRVLRSVNEDYRPMARHIYDLFARHGLEGHGFAETWLADVAGFEFEHKRYTTSFPHEWPGAMLKDAALFHLGLFGALAPHGLTLKDALPNNIVFDGPVPRFVDFLSIVETDRLSDETWLRDAPSAVPDLRRTVLSEMFECYFLLPLLAHALGKPDFARQVLRHQACNMPGHKPSARQLYRTLPKAKLIRAWLFIRACRKAITMSFPAAWDRLATLASKLPVADDTDYATYYDGKGENFPLVDTTQWRAKQLGVAQALDQDRPRSVLDIGANTGWFSRLAASRGAKVFSLDIDESSLNALYRHAKDQGLDILPLRISFGEIEQTLDDDGGAVYFSAPLSRLRADMTLMLGLIHHLALGENRSLDAILGMLARTCHKSAVVEFVSLDDPLVAGNPGYFPSIDQWNTASYNLQCVVDAARRHFASVRIIPSHPETRTLLHLHK